MTTTTTTTSTDSTVVSGGGTLHDYDTGEALRDATAEEAEASREAATRDGGAGVITVDGVRCYVQV